ncbi:MAG TPA: acyltransferase [Candidatus Syntrophosphaera sp.]|nr:acyltransferase [Candidatus Cloacimonadota bacterium]HOR02694.1 acyltransferase [Candidatus Syntrophosphaera sp.]
MRFNIPEKNVHIIANDIKIGKNVSFGNNVNVELKGSFTVGDYCQIGANTSIKGNNVHIGNHLFLGPGVTIGGGGRQHPNANLSIGDRCSIYCNLINVCEEIVIGNDVGLSPEVALITHGFWLNVLEGYPQKFAGIKIGNGVIVGYRSVILMGVDIADYCVIGAHSVITRSLTKKGIYAGSPARYLSDIKPVPQSERKAMMENMLAEYSKISSYHGIKPSITMSYPLISINNFQINVETLEYSGIEDRETDDFRDYIRKWGIRIYTERPFISCYSIDG